MLYSAVQHCTALCTMSAFLVECWTARQIKASNVRVQSLHHYAHRSACRKDRAMVTTLTLHCMPTSPCSLRSCRADQWQCARTVRKTSSGMQYSTVLPYPLDVHAGLTSGSTRAHSAMCSNHWRRRMRSASAAWRGRLRSAYGPLGPIWRGAPNSTRMRL